MQEWGEACGQSSWKTLNVLKCKSQVPSSLRGPTIQTPFSTLHLTPGARSLQTASRLWTVCCPACEVSVCSCLILPPCLSTQNLRVRSSGGTEFFTRSATKFKGALAQKFMFVDGDRAVCGSYR